MAADLDLEKETVTHHRGYEGFLAMMKWGAILSFITAMVVVFLIAD
ncbi:MAG TPA: aa3-type cytochrome c oxidase subunit IV [Allosphingosinicella sp.]